MQIGTYNNEQRTSATVTVDGDAYSVSFDGAGSVVGDGEVPNKVRASLGAGGTIGDMVESYAIQRLREYPAPGDQLDALWKGGKAEVDMRKRIEAIKAKYPAPK